MTTTRTEVNVLHELVIGLSDPYRKEAAKAHGYSPILIDAMDQLALALGTTFPKTFTAFLRLCQTPLNLWYPFSISPKTLNWALLQDEGLTEPALDLLYSLPAEIIEQAERDGSIARSALDNLIFRQFIDEMRRAEDRTAAQHTYQTIRSFLITHSWMTRKDLRELTNAGIAPERIEWLKDALYEPDDNDEFYTCERCGILRYVHSQWVGVKPAYCDDHSLSAPHIHLENAGHSRLKLGIHLRTFIPGQAEKSLFEAADLLHDEFADHLTNVERYPGIDSYDLRLTFRDEVWAVDVKDIAEPDALAREIRPMTDSGDLWHHHEYYVIADRRLDLVPDYLEQANRQRAAHPNISLLSQTYFIQKMRDKCEALVRASR